MYLVARRVGDEHQLHKIFKSKEELKKHMEYLLFSNTSIFNEWDTFKIDPIQVSLVNVEVELHES